MKNKYHFLLLITAFLTGISMPARSQYSMGASPRIVGASNNPMTGGIRNYKTFTERKADLSDEVLTANRGFENHPEIGTKWEGAPTGDVFELIGKRTEVNKTFVKKGSNGLETYTQTASAPIHYKDEQGNWRTIKTQLEPDQSKQGVYAAYEQPAPIAIDANRGVVSIGKQGKNFSFNNNLELVYVKADGTEQSLGNANWTNHTAGDEGVYVSNAWSGVDIEMYVIRGAIKTNFLIRHAMPEYADGKLVVRDHLVMDAGMSLYADGQTTYAGNMEIRNSAGEKVYDMSAASACEKGNIKQTLQILNYHISGNNLDIELPGNFLNRAEKAYPVIIDPLVSLATTSAVTGSSYSTDWTVPCVYANAATVPANITITDVQFAFTFASAGIAWIADGAIDFRKGACRSPTGPTGLAGFYWACTLVAGPGTCAATGGATYSIYPDISACIPPPQCPTYNLNLTMDFYQMTGPTAACATTYIYATTPLVITVVGHTVEFVSTTASATTICSGASTTLSGTGIYGVPPYTFTWTPGPVTGSPVTVSPAATTTYTLTITDACGITATGTRTITVNTEAPITGTPTVCVGNTTNLADATGGAHTWTSSNPGVATVTAGGVVTGVSVGTTTITYTSTATGCYATLLVNVTPIPSAITGTTTICVGSTSILSDATAGGTWTSSNPAVATVSAAGLVTAIASGTTVITYSLGGACVVTVTVTVNLLAAITGPTSVCPGSTITLNDAAGAGTWTSSNPAVATVSTTGVVTGVSPGVVTITFATPTGCSTTTTITVNNIAPITGTLSVCAGGTTALADAAGAGTWSSSNPAVATVSAGGLVTGVSAGTTVITFITTAGGCSVTATVTVSDVAAIGGATTVCSGQTIVLTDATAGGTWSSSSTAVATIDPSTGSLLGVSGGTTTITYQTGAGCYKTLLVTVTPVSPITGTLTVCAGSTTALADAAGAGTWSSSNTAVATVGGTTGLVSGISAGSSTITYTNSVGCSTTAAVVVNGLPVLGGTTSVCVGNNTGLTTSVVGGTWSTTASTIASVGAASGTVTGISAGTATITYTSPAGCVSTIDVVVNPIPAAITGPLSVCQGFTATLNDATGGGSWNSSNPAVASVNAAGVATGVTGGTVLMSYTSSAGCVNTANFTVNSTPPAISGTTSLCVGATAYVFDAMAGGSWSSATTTVATIDPSSGLITGVTQGTSVVTYTSSFGCFITTTIYINPLPANIGGKKEMCEGATSVLTDAAAGGTWVSGAPITATVDGVNGLVTGLVAGTANITYTVAGCSTISVVTVDPNPSAIDGLNSLCTQATETLSDAMAGGMWSSNDAAVASIDPTTGVLTGVSYGVFTITYTLPTGCLVTGTDTIQTAPKVSFYVNPNVCIGDTVKVEMTSSSNGISSYTWNFGLANLVAASSNTFGPYYVTWPGAGTYYISVTGNATVFCPSLTAQDTILVHNFPNATILDPIFVNGNGTSVCTGDSVMLRAAYQDLNYSYYWWPVHYFEQNNIGTVYATVERAGYIWLTIHDEFGCTATDSVMVNAQPCCQVSIPNAFSPNNDGLNDIFRPIGIGTHGIHVFRVMNRWGQTVFETVANKVGWDGVFNGVPQDIGTYYYYLSYDCDGKTIVEKGEVTLVR